MKGKPEKKNIDIKDIPTICDLVEYLLDIIFGNCNKKYQSNKKDQKKDWRIKCKCKI